MRLCISRVLLLSTLYSRKPRDVGGYPLCCCLVTTPGPQFLHARSLMLHVNVLGYAFTTGDNTGGPRSTFNVRFVGPGGSGARTLEFHSFEELMSALTTGLREQSSGMSAPSAATQAAMAALSDRYTRVRAAQRILCMPRGTHLHECMLRLFSSLRGKHPGRTAHGAETYATLTMLFKRCMCSLSSGIDLASQSATTCLAQRP